MKEYIKVTLQKRNGQKGYVWWQDGDKGLQVGMTDAKTGCRITDMEYFLEKPKNVIFND